MIVTQKHIGALAVISALLFPGALFAGTPSLPVMKAEVPIESVFQSVSERATFPIQVPSVIELPLSGAMQFQSALVKDLTTGDILTSYIRSERRLAPTPYEVFSSRENFDLGMSAPAMNDRNLASFVAFPIEPNASMGKREIFIQTREAITSSALSFAFDNNVTIPATVDIRTVALDGQETVVVAERPLTYSGVNFPRTTASLWHITFTYRQPVRITEITLAEDFPKYTDLYFLRFLAVPNNEYQIFTHPDRRVDNIVVTQHAGNLSSNQNIALVEAPMFSINSVFKESDEDADGIPDKRDNCVSFPNPTQEDINHNGLGEECEDYDRDYVMNAKDNCATTVNSNQRDTDSDGIGDVCDPQDSRFTEEHPWIPWVGIGSAGAVLILLFVLTVKAKKLNEEEGANI